MYCGKTDCFTIFSYYAAHQGVALHANYSVFKRGQCRAPGNVSRNPSYLANVKTLKEPITET